MAGARETLSPLVRSAQARRLSLELCQKLGNQFLSPSRGQQSSAELSPLAKNPNTTSSPSGSKWSPHWMPPSSGTGNRRGSLGCPSPFSGNLSGINGKITEIRRGSLNATSTALLQPFQIPSIRVDNVSSQTVDESNTGKTLRDYNLATSFIKSDDANGSCSTGLSHYLSGCKRSYGTENEDPADDDNQKRRKSSSSRYGFDEAFTQLVAEKCQLFIDADEVLGRGSFGTVVSGVYKGKPIAAKIVQTKSTHQIESIVCEQTALELPSHTNVVRLIDIFQLGTDRAIVVMERLLKGNLLTILNDPSVSYLNSPTRLRIALELASALQFCHSNGILHLDVKPQNILIDFDGCCKLTDFGNSRRLSDLMLSSSYIKLDGTVAYKAPELFRGVRPTGKSDVYSYGITLWQILTREIPYDGENEHSVIYKVVAQGHRPIASADTEAQLANELKQASNGTAQLYNYKNLYEYCWSEEPNSRPDINSVVNHLDNLQQQDE